MRSELKERILKGVVTILLFTSVFCAARQAAVLVNEGEAETEERFCVVIDAGHGGVDPGKIGINGALEKEINLQVAEKLKAFLEASDVKVVMTRTTDGGLYDENASNKKVQDMKQRIQIIEEAQPQLAVSIHQNSYGEEYVDGAQVFYYEAAFGKGAGGDDTESDGTISGSGKPPGGEGQRQLLSSEKDGKTDCNRGMRLPVQRR